MAFTEEGRRRVVIEGVKPEIDAGRFPIKRTVGESIIVEADMFTDGHDALSGVLMFRKEGAKKWSEVPMEFLVNDRWRGEFTVTELGLHQYTLQAWVDHFKSWARDLVKRVEAEQDISVDLLIGAAMVEDAATRAKGRDATKLSNYGKNLRARAEGAVEEALSQDLATLMNRCVDRSLATTYHKTLEVVVDPERARYSAWYEMFPRSAATEPGKHGTFKDVINRLPYVSSLGFDVIYLPPIHPIGQSFRKGKNNNVVSQPGEPGSPWAIGSEEGGHKSIHPELGTLEEFHELVAASRELNIEIALDIAFQASPDHPYVKEHPEWFLSRPDGTIQYAENPPKKYQDIYPFYFETSNWQELWEELKSVFVYWIEQGVRIFRVDNPHTKPFDFWEWLITDIKRDYPETIFLSEAFTRPKVLYRLAKLGFTQSYNYFPWRNTSWELTEFLTELTQTEVQEYLRPSLWPNTPDILTEYLQVGGRPAFMTRLVLAATLGACYGMYGPAFEFGDNQPLAPGKEEYLNSEKYEIKVHDLDRPDSLKDLIARVNHIRRGNPALHFNERIRFHHVDNEQILAYTKTTKDLSNVVLVVVNLDPHYTQAGWIDLPLEELGINPQEPYQVHDLLDDSRYIWTGPRNYVELRPHTIPASIFLVRRRVRSERDFDYYQ